MDFLSLGIMFVNTISAFIRQQLEMAHEFVDGLYAKLMVITQAILDPNADLASSAAIRKCIQITGEYVRSVLGGSSKSIFAATRALAAATVTFVDDWIPIAARNIRYALELIHNIILVPSLGFLNAVWIRHILPFLNAVWIYHILPFTNAIWLKYILPFLVESLWVLINLISLFVPARTPIIGYIFHVRRPVLVAALADMRDAFLELADVLTLAVQDLVRFPVVRDFPRMLGEALVEVFWYMREFLGRELVLFVWPMIYRVSLAGLIYVKGGSQYLASTLAWKRLLSLMRDSTTPADWLAFGIVLVLCAKLFGLRRMTVVLFALLLVSACSVYFE